MGAFFNPREIHNVQMIQKNTHIIICPYYYMSLLLLVCIPFTYIIHCINKYFKPGSLHQFYKFLGYLHSFIKRTANITVILHSILCLFRSSSLLYMVTYVSMFAHIKLFPHLSNTPCGSYFRFHWCLKIDDKRANVNLSVDTS